MTSSPTIRLGLAIAAPCALWISCLLIAPRAIERDVTQRVHGELHAAGLGHLPVEVDGRDVVVEVPLSLPGGVDTLRRRVAALAGVRSVRMLAVGDAR